VENIYVTKNSDGVTNQIHILLRENCCVLCFRLVCLAIWGGI